MRTCAIIHPLHLELETANQINQSNELSAGGGFQPRLVDSHHACLRRVTSKHRFAGKLQPLSY